MTETHTDDIDMRRLVEASAWRFRLTEDGIESCEAFEAWCADSDNAIAMSQVDRSWKRLVEEAASPGVMALRINALARARRRGYRRWRVSPVMVRTAAAFAAVAVLAAGYGGWQWWDARPDIYQTGAGERRIVRLKDGSLVSLDSSSRISVHYTDDARRLELAFGQARFEVAHDIERPFMVRASEQTVLATGTIFNIDLQGQKTIVSLLEGRVTVLNVHDALDLQATAGSAPAIPVSTSSVSLVAGQQLITSAARPPSVKVVSRNSVTAWESGQLIFQDDTLADAAERVSRYSGQPITVESGAQNLKMSGAFISGDAATFLDAVEQYLPVKVTTDRTGTIIAAAVETSASGA